MIVRFTSMVALALMAVVTLAPTASAQSASDKAAAEALFEKGKQLLDASNFAEACPKFEASQKLDAGVGTLLYLGDCYEKAARIASAWATFREAESVASSRGDQERAGIAKERADVLEPRLSKLWLKVAPENPPDLEVRRHGAIVPRETWGLAIPVDSGDHLIEASAPNKEPWSQTVTVTGEKANVSIEIPVLMDAVEAPEPPPAGAPATEPAPAPADVMADSSDDGSGQRTIGLVVGGAGVVGLALGTVFGLSAKSKNDDSKEECRPDDETLCSPAGVQLRDDAKSAATISTVAFAIGGAALATGLVVYFTAPSSSDSSGVPSGLHVATQVAPSGGAVTLGGAW